MGNIWKLVLYFINLAIMVTAMAGLLYALIMMLVFQNEWLYWLLAVIGCFCALILFAVLYVVRKQKFPVAGKDYL